jgi:hypothetical protein
MAAEASGRSCWLNGRGGRRQAGGCRTDLRLRARMNKCPKINNLQAKVKVILEVVCGRSPFHCRAQDFRAGDGSKRKPTSPVFSARCKHNFKYSIVLFSAGSGVPVLSAACGGIAMCYFKFGLQSTDFKGFICFRIVLVLACLYHHRLAVEFACVTLSLACNLLIIMELCVAEFFWPCGLASGHWRATMSELEGS